MGAFLKYTVLRLGLLIACLAVFALLGLRGVLLVLVAALASLALSYVLLRGARDDLSAAIARRADPTGRQRNRVSEDDAAEDAALDARDRRHPEP